MNRHPVIPITDDDVETYNRDGVVCIRKLFDQDWVDMLLPIVRRLVIDKERMGLLPTAPLRNPGRMIEEVRQFSFFSPLGEAAGRILQSKEIRYFFEEFFAKAPQSSEKTIWHADRAGWPVAGQMVPSIWVALTPIVRANSLEVIVGSHKHDELYWLFSPNARKMIQPPDRLNHPDGESLRDHPDVEFRTWEMEPGDTLFLHPWALHYATGNPTDNWRFALSSRVFGDDIVWAPRPDCLNMPGASFDEMIPGIKPRGPGYPLLWSEDGRKDSIESHPKGFATAWDDKIYEEVGHLAAMNSKGFEEMLEESGGPTPLPYPFEVKS